MHDAQKTIRLVCASARHKLSFGGLGFLTVMSLSGFSWADIRTPGAHIRYGFELEPEAIFVMKRPLNDGPGVGVRGSIPVLFNGFIPQLNNSVAITFGFDKDPVAKGRSYYMPVALQWNFWIAPIFSVAGEPGLLFEFADKVRVYPQVWGGARLHFTETVALMARVSLPEAPAFSIGVSFFL
jgi:hypothetical protein